MMLPILISVSEAPGSYFFCAMAGLMPTETQSRIDASRRIFLCAMSASPCCCRPCADLEAVWGSDAKRVQRIAAGRPAELSAARNGHLAWRRRLRFWYDVWHLSPDAALPAHHEKDFPPMSMPALFKGRLSIPVIGAPLFIISVPDLVIAQCKAGVVGSFPALNARPPALLDEWLARIRQELAAYDAAHPQAPSAPFAVNQIVHRSNNRLEHDLALCEKHKVPMIITSLGAREELNQAAHRWGGIVFHDVINQKFAHKAIEKGADGLILVAAGAGGHAGMISPFAFVAETRQWFGGPIALSGAISNGRAIRAARMLGADFAYIGSAFIATREANAVEGYKQMITNSSAEDIVYSNLFTGVHGNYLKPSIMAAGMDPDNLPTSDASKMSFGTDASGERAKPKAWKEIWGSGQGVGSVATILPAAELIGRFKAEYEAAVDPPL
jgi:nitronate monooxygenase